ncbi:hypothetical protein FGO68_gene12710 [Halteria grandinella]|uniref:Uncharacterized protein n=1 Tax=Halteria grandinella TaxID=5974 RepID=A0A8J8NEU7_HALGN|nr:hypothetical protein FGO68_gene12710 [Halteria grandinella]
MTPSGSQDDDNIFEIDVIKSDMKGASKAANGSQWTFSYSDVVPIKYYHYLKEYDFEKNLPSIRERIKIQLLKSRITGKRYVCKSINYCGSDERNIIKEIDLQAKLDHPNIPRIVEVFIHQNTAFIIKEFCRGGFLSQWLSNNPEPLSELLIVQFVYQLLSAIAYLHSNRIVHTNIKLETLLINYEKQKTHAKQSQSQYVVSLQLMSFDNALEFKEGQSTVVNQLVGQQGNEFSAPEIFQGGGNNFDAIKLDEYSVGIVLYHLLTRTYPYKFTRHKSDQETHQALLSQEPPTFSTQEWTKLTHATEFILLIQGLLERDPSLRFTAKKALKSPLFKLARMQLYQQNQGLIIETINFKPRANFGSVSNMIKQGMLLYIATKLLNPQKYQDLTQVFQTLDYDADGYLDIQDIQHFLKQTQLLSYLDASAKETPQDSKFLTDIKRLYSIFSPHGAKKSMRLSYSQFNGAIVELRYQELMGEDVLAKAFVSMSGSGGDESSGEQRMRDTDESLSGRGKHQSNASQSSISSKITLQQLFDTIKNSFNDQTEPDKVERFVRAMKKVIDQYQPVPVKSGFSAGMQAPGNQQSGFKQQIGFGNGSKRGQIGEIQTRSQSLSELSITFDTFKKIMSS